MSAIRPAPIEGIPQYLNAAQSVDMAGAAHALVWGAASTAETQVAGHIILVDANATGGGTSVQALTLPSATEHVGSELFIFNIGGEAITLNDNASTRLLSNASVVLVSGAGVWSVKSGAKAVGIASGSKFVSTEQTGTGSSQNVAHGLGTTPSVVWWSLSGPSGGADTVTPGSHDATNLKFTVTSGVKFYAFAIL